MVRSRGKITIKDVAQKANVTAQTVSRVMRGEGCVSIDTKKKVLDVAKQLQYIPSYAATALRNGMNRSIAIVFDSLRNMYFSIMIDHLRAEIVKQGYSVQLIFSDSVIITESYYRKAISHGAVAVISFLEGEEGIGGIVKDCGVPLMIFGRSTTDERLDFITTDDTKGGQLVAKRLLEKKCTQFKYLVEGSGMTCARDRYEGFDKELKKHGFSAEILDLNHMGEDAYLAIDFDNPNIGVFCFSDVLAFNLIKRVSSVSTDRRPKVIGYDNIQSDIVLPINLTTVGVNKEKHAQFAIDCITAKLADPALHFAEREPVELFEGETA